MSIDKLFSLKNQVIIITGGYGYLGKGMVEALLAAEAEVVVAGRSVEKFNAAFSPDSKLHFWKTDICNTQDIKSLFESIWNRFGRIDCLINNAFVTKTDGSPEALSDDAMMETLQGSLAAVYSSIREVVPYFRKQKYGRIINISSMYGIVAPDFSIYDSAPQFLNPPHYGAAKAGLIQLTKYFAVYLGKENILVNAISPGPFPGEAVQKAEEFVDNLKEKTALGRIGNPGDLQGAIIFLCAPGSSFITGHNLVVDGGWTVK